MQYLILLGLLVLAGFTFYQDTPGRITSGSGASADAFEAACDAVTRQFSGRTITLPPQYQARTHTKQQPDGSFTVTSWLDERDRFGSMRRRAWSARVTCGEAGCRTSNLRVNG